MSLHKHSPLPEVPGRVFFNAFFACIFFLACSFSLCPQRYGLSYLFPNLPPDISHCHGAAKWWKEQGWNTATDSNSAPTAYFHSPTAEKPFEHAKGEHILQLFCLEPQEGFELQRLAYYQGNNAYPHMETDVKALINHLLGSLSSTHLFEPQVIGGQSGSVVFSRQNEESPTPYKEALRIQWKGQTQDCHVQVQLRRTPLKPK